MKKQIFFIASFLGAMSIIFGAFGAHYLEDYLISEGRVNTFETAVKYQFYHVFFLMVLGFGYDIFNKTFIKYACFSVLIGIVLFSGSLYMLCFTNNNLFGLITPFGGVSLVCAWILFFLSVKYASS